MSKPIVYVDLDGTLTPSDTLLECCLLLLKKNILYVFPMLWWAIKGAWVFKTEISRRVDPVLDHLPINPAVLERLNQLKSAGHVLVLASASVYRDVKKVALRLGLFDRVIASQDSNLKGLSKLQAIEADSKGQAFIYFGDSSVDIAVWKNAAVAFGVNTSASTRAKAAAAGVSLNRVDSELAVAGAGITFGMEESFRAEFEAGRLVPILQPFCPSFAGFYLYYPNRRHLAPKLRALIDHLREGTA